MKQILTETDTKMETRCNKIKIPEQDFKGHKIIKKYINILTEHKSFQKWESNLTKQAN